MTGDDRMTWGLITDILDVLERHGYTRGDNQHTGRAIGLISDLAHIYEGTQDHPYGPYVDRCRHPSRAEPAPPGPAARTSSPSRPGEVRTLLAALDIAADYKRDRAETCADCADQTCLACQSRLRDARRLRPAGRPDDSRPPRPPDHPAARARPCARPARPAADQEAGQ